MSVAAAATGFTADPATLSSASQAFTAAAGDLSTAVTTLVGRLQADGACWGDDSQGSTFGGVYQPRADQMVNDLQELVAGLQAASTALTNSANQYASADAASTLTPSS